jgi:hypothetical protein
LHRPGAACLSARACTETTTHVRNIYKYYVAYRLTLDAQARAEDTRRTIAPKN